MSAKGSGHSDSLIIQNINAKMMCKLDWALTAQIRWTVEAGMAGEDPGLSICCIPPAPREHLWVSLIELSVISDHSTHQAPLHIWINEKHCYY